MESERHQLAAIMFTDIVGYTSLMQSDEGIAMTVIRKYNEVLDAAISNYHGRLANNYGDGSLCIFSSANQAINAAIFIQQKLREKPAVPLRIGLHIGEIFFEDGKIFGDGVNVASRIQSLGQANSILFSGEILDKIKNHPEFQTISLGKFSFKNVSQSVEVFALASAGMTVPDKNKLEGKLQEKQKRKALIPILIGCAVLLGALFYFLYFNKHKVARKDNSIAVIPFTNKSRNGEEVEYLCTGVPQFIAGLLTNTGTIEVKGMAASSQFRDSKLKSADISSSLGNPSTLLQGTIEKIGKGIVVFVELIDVANDNQMWSHTYPYNEAKELFAIQSDVANQVAKELNIRLTQNQLDQINRLPTKNTASYDDFLKGTEYKIKNLGDDIGDRYIDSAEMYFLRAVKKDSSFTQAWLGLAEIYNYKSNGNGSHLVLNNQCQEALLKILRVDPGNSDAYAIMADLIKKYSLNPKLGIEQANIALRLNPNNPTAYMFRSAAELDMGRFDEARQDIERAIQIDPVNYFFGFDNWLVYVVVTHDTTKLKYLVDKYRGTTKHMYSRFRNMLLFETGKFDSLYMFRAEAHDTSGMVSALIGMKQTEKAISLAHARIATLKQNEEQHSYSIALLYGQIGEFQESLRWLQKSFFYRDYGLTSIRTDRQLNGLRNDTAFRKLVEKLGGD